MKEYNIPRGTIARIMGIERPKESKAATEEEGHLAEEERMFDDVGVYVQDPNINIKWIYDGTSTPTSEWDKATTGTANNFHYYCSSNST